MFAIKSLFGILLLTILTGKISAGPPVIKCDEDRVNHIYPFIDPTWFYYCKDKGTPVAVKCPEGTGFQYNQEAVGCVPWEYWSCTYKGGYPPCEKGTAGTFTRHIDPTKYYYCKDTNMPWVIPCPAGTAYTYTKDMSGCVPWDMWNCSNQVL